MLTQKPITYEIAEIFFNKIYNNFKRKFISSLIYEEDYVWENETEYWKERYKNEKYMFFDNSECKVGIIKPEKQEEFTKELVFYIYNIIDKITGDNND